MKNRGTEPRADPDPEILRDQDIGIGGGTEPPAQNHFPLEMSVNSVGLEGFVASPTPLNSIQPLSPPMRNEIVLPINNSTVSTLQQSHKKSPPEAGVGYLFTGKAGKTS